MATVMIVEDMPVFRDPLAASLRRNGYETITVGDGREAIARLAAGLPDLILLDVAMPVMDGFVFLDRLRSDPFTRGIPVLVLSAISDQDAIAQAKAFGVTDYLLKSRFSLMDLLERVRRMLPGHQRLPTHDEAACAGDAAVED